MLAGHAPSVGSTDSLSRARVTDRGAMRSSQNSHSSKWRSSESSSCPAEYDLPPWLSELDEGELELTLLGEQDCLLRFRCRLLEMNFADELHDRYRATVRFGAAVYGMICLVLAVQKLYSWGFPHVDVVGWIVMGCSMVSVLITLCCMVLTCVRRVNLGHLLVVSCCAALLFAVGMNTVRVSRLAGSSFHREVFEGCGALSCYDDSLQTMSFLVVSALIPAVIGIRFANAIWVPVWGTLLYFGTCPVGPMLLFEHLIVGLAYVGTSSALFVSKYRTEGKERRRWLVNNHLKVSLALQEKELVQEMARAQQIEEQFEALTNALRNPEAAADNNKNKEDNESTAPHRTVPTPRDVLREEGDDTRGSLTQGDIISNGNCPNPLLARVITGCRTDPLRLRRMATRIRDPDYGMQAFFQDCAATFPELDFFFAAERLAVGEVGHHARGGHVKAVTRAATFHASSGNSNFVEYQRTIGALFAVYWLLRLDVDGKQGFSFGYDSQWKVKSCSRHVKRMKFFAEMRWPYFEEVVSLALQGSLERLEAMLCLTAFHDIMKVTQFCPKVAAVHAPYHGYQYGEIITDHDVALAYILEHYSDMLPSFRILPPESREVVLFTQNKMHFNHGWFVQAESTAGHTLSQLKSVLSQAHPGDFAFYFLHWFTDLSGAEGQPLAGAEKFATRFPQSVLASFLWSIPYLQQLRTQTETEVMEAYLTARFKGELPNVAVPTDFDSIALMRLVVMGQMSAQHVLTSWGSLCRADFQVLVEELSLTGIEGQNYRCWADHGGPAFFVYYGPALLQCCSSGDKMKTALSILASVYRAGRRLWPLGTRRCTIMLEIGAMKPKFTELVKNSGDPANSIWILLRRGNMEAGVVLATGRQLNGYIAQGAEFTVLDMGDHDEPEVTNPRCQTAVRQFV